MRRRCRLRSETGWAEFGYSFDIQNGCSQSSRFPTAGQGERRLGTSLLCSLHLARHTAHDQCVRKTETHERGSEAAGLTNTQYVDFSL